MKAENERALVITLKRLQEAAELSKEDPETAHPDADRALTDFLEHLGYNVIVHAYWQVRKHYA